MHFFTVVIKHFIILFLWVFIPNNLRLRLRANRCVVNKMRLPDDLALVHGCACVSARAFCVRASVCLDGRRQGGGGGGGVPQGRAGVTPVLSASIPDKL